MSDAVAITLGEAVALASDPLSPESNEIRRGLAVKAGLAVVNWPHETPPGRCIHWPKTCAEVQAAQTTVSKPCAHCAPSLYVTDNPHTPVQDSGDHLVCLSAAQLEVVKGWVTKSLDTAAATPDLKPQAQQWLALLNRLRASTPAQDSEVPQGLGEPDRKKLRSAADFLDAVVKTSGSPAVHETVDVVSAHLREMADRAAPQGLGDEDREKLRKEIAHFRELGQHERRECERATDFSSDEARFFARATAYEYVVERLRKLRQEDSGDGHRVVMRFDGGGPWLKLIHPESGCTKPTRCGLCAADLTDPEATRCYDCKDMKAEGCWLDGWFDNLSAEELLHGEITVAIDAEWDMDHPVITVKQPGKQDSDDLREWLTSDEAVEIVAETIWNEREFRDPTGDPPDDWCPPGHDVHQPPPSEPALWAELVAAGKYPASIEETRTDARAILAALSRHSTDEEGKG